ncbi:hypothetical protein EV644_12217 [Kribbella orskensis]|uniref:Uncharacterized protein n=1 Tax=Kribbella orskensis TaxID=2512216 RepID=A0ABY2BAA4_9ACTN|nr:MULTISPECIES: hypothetical protein [Kribbella]TCN33396.1 hypothetical protein EV642_12417 [Kribbella sp. VKM Ac-2500]TCO13542.1 hypothetical protein EV644_12217 [Kribbella orskensis]
MTDIDKARAQREALANAAGRRTAGPSRTAQATERYLGAALYEARHGHHEKAADEQDTEQPPDAPPTTQEPPHSQTT